VVGLGAGLAVLAGCRDEQLPGESSGAASPVTDESTGSAAPTPDAGLEALDRAIELTLASIALTERARPRADPGGRLLALHRTHLRVLQSATEPPTSVSASPTPTTSPTTEAPPGRPDVRRVRTHEAALRGQLADLALVATDGGLARLFATMSAGVAAHLSALPPLTPGRAT